MGLFSLLNKNKQETAGDDSGYVARDDDDAIAAKARSKRASSAGGDAERRPRERKGAPDPVLPEKKRARRRLVGAVALALAVAVGLPMILDSEPKPLSSDIDIRIPSKDKAPPLAMPAEVPAAAALDTREEIVEPSRIADPAPLPSRSVPVPLDVAEVKLDKPELKAVPKPELKAVPKPEPKAADKPAVKPLEAKAAVKADAKPDAERALAILEDKPAAAPSTQKYVVQVVALQSPEKVAEVQARLKAAGIASFTQKSGEWIRVRVGPFSREEGEAIRAKLSALGLSGKIQPN